MLININPILGPELLATLRAMGHGDEIAVVGGNYPALEHARRLIRLDGMQLIPVIDAILSVLPVDDFVEQSLFRASKRGDPEARDPIHMEMEALCRKYAPDQALHVLVGDALYKRVKSAHAVVATTEQRLFSVMIIRKGVISARSI